MRLSGATLVKYSRTLHKISISRKCQSIEFSSDFLCEYFKANISMYMHCCANYYTKIGKERENLFWKNEEIFGSKKHVNTQKFHWNVSTITDVFLHQKRVNVCEHMVKMVSHDNFGKVLPGWVHDRKEEEWRGWREIEWPFIWVQARNFLLLDPHHPPDQH